METNLKPETASRFGLFLFAASRLRGGMCLRAISMAGGNSFFKSMVLAYHAFFCPSINQMVSGSPAGEINQVVN